MQIRRCVLKFWQNFNTHLRICRIRSYGLGHYYILAASWKVCHMLTSGNLDVQIKHNMRNGLYRGLLQTMLDRNPGILFVINSLWMINLLRTDQNYCIHSLPKLEVWSWSEQKQFAYTCTPQRISAATRQNQQSDMCAERKLGLALAPAQSDQSPRCA